uniref:Uncharacterized protein n=1 Tax=Glossina pallidipes TaxID=7398 RepID=A0A1B0ABA0_GLOPL
MLNFLSLTTSKKITFCVEFAADSCLVILNDGLLTLLSVRHTLTAIKVSLCCCDLIPFEHASYSVSYLQSIDYDPFVNEWNLAAPMKDSHHSHESCVFNNHIYVIDGYMNSIVENYNPKTYINLHKHS